MKMVHLQLNSSRLLLTQPRWKKAWRTQTKESAMSSVASVADAAAELASTFSGRLLKPADVGYEDARKVHNGLVDKRPALIARCRGVADVADAIGLTRKLGLEVAVRGGGHNVAGRATIDGGVMIDLAPMKGIHVDAKSPYGAGAGRCHLGRAQSRDAAARPGDHGRGGFQHGDRRAHPRWRTGLADGQAWPRARQSRLCRARHRRRQDIARQQGRRARPVLGRARWRR